MARHEIKCVNKSKRISNYGSILSIGGINSDGTNWRISVERAIEGIESGKWEFYVKVNNIKTNVIIRVYNGKKILRTVNDSSQRNNLSNLPECII